MTVRELINRLQELPPELPVYTATPDEEWIPLEPTDVRPGHFVMSQAGLADWWFLFRRADGPVNGIGI